MHQSEIERAIKSLDTRISATIAKLDELEAKLVAGERAAELAVVEVDKALAAEVAATADESVGKALGALVVKSALKELPKEE